MSNYSLDTELSEEVRLGYRRSMRLVSSVLTMVKVRTQMPLKWGIAPVHPASAPRDSDKHLLTQHALGENPQQASYAGITRQTCDQ